MNSNAVDAAVYSHSAAVWNLTGPNSGSSRRLSNWRQKGFILTFLTAAFRYHATNRRFDESVLTFLKEDGCIRYFNREAIALEKNLPPLICTSDPEAVPYQSLTGMDKQMHLARTMARTMDLLIQKRVSEALDRQRDEAYKRIDQALAKMPETIDTAIVRLWRILCTMPTA